MLPLNLTLDRVITHYSEATPNEPAIEFHDGRLINWSTLEQYICGTADSLAKHIPFEGCVALLCEDSLDFHVTLNSIWRCGGAVLLISRTWGPAVIQDLLTMLDIRVIFANERINESLFDGDVLPIPKPVLKTDAGKSCSYSSHQVAIYATTSGTTDNPKCIPLTHFNLRTAYQTGIRIRGLQQIRKAAALFRVNGIGVLGVSYLFPREVGACTVMFEPFEVNNCRQSWQKVLTGDIDFVYVVPPVLRLLNAFANGVGQHGRTGKLTAFCSSAPVDIGDLDMFEKSFPVTVYNTYGLTELSFAVFFGARKNDGTVSDSIGVAEELEAKIIDNDNQELISVGEGELIIKGPSLASGYHLNEKATSESFKNGWLQTGDIAYRDETGKYYIVGRKKDVAIRGGTITYFHEVEYYVRQLKGVIDAACYISNTNPSGDELTAVIQSDEQLTVEMIYKWLLEKIGKEKSPNVVHVTTNEIPRNMSGKVDRKRLKDFEINR